MHDDDDDDGHNGDDDDDDDDRNLIRTQVRSLSADPFQSLNQSLNLVVSVGNMWRVLNLSSPRPPDQSNHLNQPVNEIN